VGIMVNDQRGKERTKEGTMETTRVLVSQVVSLGFGFNEREGREGSAVRRQGL